jgi:hypothetical protein
MNWIQTISGVAVSKLPKVISPKGHAIADYVMAAGAFAAAIAFFKTDRKLAGTGALITGIAETTNALITDYPGGVFKVISFPTHGRIDVGETSMVASLPRVMGFSGEPESKFFYAHAAAAMAVVGMTDFGGDGAQRQITAHS